MAYSNILIGIILGIIFQVLLIKISEKIDYEYYSKFKILPIIINSIILAYFLNKYEFNIKTIIISVVISITISSSFIDLKYQEIPDSYNFTTMLLGILFIVLNKQYYESLIMSGAIIFAIYFCIMILSGAMGGGDVKMAGALGLMLGKNKIISFLVGSFFAGAVLGLVLMVVFKKGKKDKFAFGPCISISAIYVLLTI